MPLLEAAAITAGLYGGYRIGSRLRQAVHDSGGVGGGAEKAAAEKAAEAAAPLRQAPSRMADGGTTITVMFVGDPTVGKTLFCRRISDPEGLGRESLPKTMAPSWERADVALPSGQRVSFQLLDTPGELPELAVPFYRHANCVVLVFDVSHAATFARLKEVWWEAVQKQRFAPSARHPPGSCVVLAHVIDERRERQVTRREAAAWSASVGLPFFETHPAEHSPQRVLVHLAAAAASDPAPDPE